MTYGFGPTMKTSKTKWKADRRSFLQSMLAAGVAPMVVSPRLLGSAAPSNKIHLGFIGVGGHGSGYNLPSFLQEDDCRAVAVCDVIETRRHDAQETVDLHNGDSDCKSYADFRELLADENVDGVVISTPDHWHVTMAILGIRAGKKVFCEKPTLTIGEGQELLEAVTKHEAVFATGLEDRSVTHYHKMAEVVRNGGIGKLKHIQVGLPIKPVYPKVDPVPVPEGLDFDLWLGPAPARDYTPGITDAQAWRQDRDFSGGSLTDWGAHLLDTAQVGNFCEVKNAVIGDGAKVNHLTYVGDADVGAGANIGAGTITCNYDGFRKFRTEIGEGAFIGSNSSLVAPVTIEAGAYVASGSVITKNVPADALAIGRSRQVDKPGWARKMRALSGGKTK